MRLVFFLFILSMFVSLSVNARAKQIVIHYDGGGDVAEYNNLFNTYEHSGSEVVIAGRCYSACARFMKLTHVCARPDAAFYFHGISDLKGHVFPEESRIDSRDHESTEAYRLQQRYGAFAFGPTRGRHKMKHLEDGVSIIYEQYEDDKTLYSKFLRVRADRLIPACPQT